MIPWMNAFGHMYDPQQYHHHPQHGFHPLNPHHVQDAAPELLRIPPRERQHGKAGHVRMPGMAPPQMTPNSTMADPARAKEAVDGFRRLFHQQAAGLLSAGVLPIPPGHPLYSKHAAISALETERNALLKENADLKRRLDSVSSEEGGADIGLPQQRQ